MRIPSCRVLLRDAERCDAVDAYRREGQRYERKERQERTAKALPRRLLGEHSVASSRGVDRSLPL